MSNLIQVEGHIGPVLSCRKLNLRVFLNLNIRKRPQRKLVRVASGEVMVEMGPDFDCNRYTDEYLSQFEKCN